MENNTENNKDFILKSPEAGQEEAKQENEKRREEIIEKYLQYFIDCRDNNYIDKISDSVVRRTDFFQSIIGKLGLMVEMKIVKDLKSIKEIDKFIGYMQDLARKEIITADFLQHIIGDLGFMEKTEIVNDPESMKKINEFIGYMRNLAREKEKITEEDNKKVNEIINYAIEILSKKEILS